MWVSYPVKVSGAEVEIKKLERHPISASVSCLTLEIFQMIVPLGSGNRLIQD